MSRPIDQRNQRNQRLGQRNQRNQRNQRLGLIWQCKATEV